MRQAFHTDSQVRSPATIHQRMDLVDNQRADRLQHPPPGFRRQQQVKRFGRRDQDMRRFLRDGLPFGRRSIARAHLHSYLYSATGFFLQQRPNLTERLLKVLANIIAQRSKRRDIKHPGLVRQIILIPFPKQRVQCRQECGQRFPGARRRADKRVLAGLNGRPAQTLGFGRTAKLPLKPFPNCGMKTKRLHVAESIAGFCGDGRELVASQRCWPEPT